MGAEAVQAAAAAAAFDGAAANEEQEAGVGGGWESEDGQEEYLQGWLRRPTACPAGRT